MQRHISKGKTKIINLSDISAYYCIINPHSITGKAKYEIKICIKSHPNEWAYELFIFEPFPNTAYFSWEGFAKIFSDRHKWTIKSFFFISALNVWKIYVFYNEISCTGKIMYSFSLSITLLNLGYNSAEHLCTKFKPWFLNSCTCIVVGHPIHYTISDLEFAFSNIHVSIIFLYP